MKQDNQQKTGKWRQWRDDIRSSFWFVPAMIVLGAVGLAAGLIALDASLGMDLGADKRWPQVFGGGVEGSRQLLSTVAGSMITVAGVVFSITIVALSLASSQYTSRVLRNFMRDLTNKVVLGVFLGIFVYCLVVLRSIHGEEKGAFVPSLAVLSGLLLALVGVATLILFIHHISLSIQASRIIAAATKEAIAAVDHLFPHGLGEDADETDDDVVTKLPSPLDWLEVPAGKSGYLQSVDGNKLVALASHFDVVLRMEHGVGEFVIEGTPLVSVAGARDLHPGVAARLNQLFEIGSQRTVEQDASFGIRQIVDVALKALSPGINDSTTATMCVDHLGAIMVRLARREIASPHRLDQGRLRVIAKGPSFKSLLAEAFDQIRQNARGNAAVLTRQLQALETIASQTCNTQRRLALRQQADLITAAARHSIPLPYDVAPALAVSQRVTQALDGSLAQPTPPTPPCRPTPDTGPCAPRRPQ